MHFPEDYIRFMRVSDGAVGEVGSAWLELWSIRTIEAKNVGPVVTPRLVFGSDGESRRYALIGGAAPGIYEIALDSTATSTGVYRGANFLEFLTSLLLRPPA